MDPKRQTLIVVLLAIVVVLGYWRLVYQPQYERIQQKKQKVTELILEKERKQKLLAELNKYKRELEEVTLKLTEVVSKLPDEKEVPMLLRTISYVAKGVGLEIESFRLQPEQRKEFYAEVGFELSLVGSYHQLGMFFYQVAKMPRIVTIRDFSISPAGSGKKGTLLKASCVGATYYFVQQPPETQRVKGKKDEGA